MSNQAINFGPMTLGMILDTTFKLYAANFFLLVGIVGLPYSLMMFFNIAIQYFGDSIEQLDFIQQTFTIMPTLLFSLVLMALVFPLSTGAATYALSHRILGHQVSVWESFQAAFKRLGTLLWAQFVVSLVVLLGFLLCIIPGIVVGICYSLLVPVVILESYNASESRHRAFSLLKDYRANALAVLLVFGMITMVVSLSSQMSLFAMDLSDSQVITQLCTILCNILTAPLSIVGIILVYYDCRMRKEGFDLELLSQNLTAETSKGVSS